MLANRYEQVLTDAACGHGAFTKEPPYQIALTAGFAANHGRLSTARIAIRPSGDCRCVRAGKRTMKTRPSLTLGPQDFRQARVADRGHIRATSDPKADGSATRMDRLQSVWPHAFHHTAESHHVSPVCRVCLPARSRSPISCRRPEAARVPLTFDKAALDTAASPAACS